MKRSTWLVGLASLLIGLVSLGSPATARAANAVAPQKFTVQVGWEDENRGVDIEAFFPANLHIHVGDTVHWNQSTHEIHTVTFLAGTPMPDLILPSPSGQPSPIMFNPQAVFPAMPANGMYDGTSFANSGLMGLDPGQVRTFDLTFTKAGTYDYLCLVHGVMMSGKIIVENVGAKLASPQQVKAQAEQEIAKAKAKVPQVIKDATANIRPPTRHPNGTTTYHVNVGFMEGQIDLMRFFPDKLVVHPGDTVEWTLSRQNEAPHTVTFLNGNPEPDLVMPVPQPSGPPLLLLNPAVFFPQNPGMPLTRQGIFSSGLLVPGGPGPTSYSLKIGDITGNEPFLCLLHDASGMKGMLTIVPKGKDHD